MDPSPGISVTSLFADFGMILFALFLVLLNGFFVAAEFAMVKLRSTRVDSIAELHGWRGSILRKVHNQLDAYLAAGVESDHECTMLDEAREKRMKGMWVFVRQGSASKNLIELIEIFELDCQGSGLSVNHIDAHGHADDI